MFSAIIIHIEQFDEAPVHDVIQDRSALMKPCS